MKSAQMEYVELEDGSKIRRTSVCFKLREQEVDGEKFLTASDAIYKRDETGALLLQYNSKPGKAEKKRLKRERVKERNAIN